MKSRQANLIKYEELLEGTDGPFPTQIGRGLESIPPEKGLIGLNYSIYCTIETLSLKVMIRSKKSNE